MSKRIEWIDTLRGFAMFFVVLGHAFINRTNIIRKYIYSFHMPLFFFISGMTAKKYELSFRDFIKKKAISLLLPYICLNIFVLIIKYILRFSLGLYNNIELGRSIIYIFKGYSNYLPCIQSWFIICLFIIEILFFLITKYIKDEKYIGITIAIIFILGYLYSITKWNYLILWHIDTALIGLLFYYLGYLFMKYLHMYNKIIENNKYLILSFILLICGFLLQNINPKISMNVNNYGNVLLFLLGAISSIIGVIILVNLLLKKSKFFKGIGLMSIFFLGYHGFILTITKTFFPIMLSNDYLTIITSFMTLILLYPIARIVLKYSPIMVGKIKFI